MESSAFQKPNGVFNVGHNVEYTHRDKNGNIKKMFTENRLGATILQLLRQIIGNPIDDEGQVKHGFAFHVAAYGLRIPFITGNWSTSRKIHNLITNAGFAGIASRLNGSGGEAAFTYIAVGTGVTAANVADTTLQTEITGSGLDRVSASVSRVNIDTTNDGARLITTFSVTGSKAITESGVLNAASSGTLLARQVFSAVNVVNLDSLAVTWTFDID